MSAHPVRSVLMLCWRDTGHPQGGGSETYLQRIGAQLAESGIAVTMRTARYPGAPRREVVDGVRISRGGGAYTVYIWAGLAMVLARIGLGPLRNARPDVVIDTQNGMPFLARLAYGRRTVVLVHHCHREQWPVAGRWTGRFGWFVESKLSPWLHRKNQYVTVSLPSVRDLAELGVERESNRRGAQRTRRCTGVHAERAAVRGAHGSRCCRGWSRTSRSRTRWTRSRCCAPGSRTCISTSSAAVGGTDRLVDHAELLGISDAVTFHGHVDDVTKHQVVQRSWVHMLPSRKEGWGLAVIEAAQHAVPTIGYRSSGGLTDSIVDGVTGVLVDDNADDLVAGLEELLTDCGAARRARPQGAGPQRRILLAAERGRDAHRAGSGRVRPARQRRRSERSDAAGPTAPTTSNRQPDQMRADQRRPVARRCTRRVPPTRYSVKSASRVGHRQRRVSFARSRFRPGPDSTTSHPTPASASGPGRHRPAAVACTVAGVPAFADDRAAGDRQVAGGQHIGAHPTRQRIEHRCRSRPGELPHGVGRQHRDGPRGRR